MKGVDTFAYDALRTVTRGLQVAAIAPTTNLAAPTRNLQNIQDKHAHQPTKKHAAP